MFNNFFGDLDDDPFFSEPLRAHREEMQRMMQSFAESGGTSTPRITDGDNGGRAAGEQLRNLMRNPLTTFDNLITTSMQQTFGDTPPDADIRSYKSTSVSTYSKVGDEPAKTFRASSSTRRAPGGIKETRRAVADSVSGLQKMSIGHHIHDRGHVVQEKVNKKTGTTEFKEDFQNMDESDRQLFENEWQQKLTRLQPSVSTSHHKEAQPRAVQWSDSKGSNPAYTTQTKGKTDGKQNMKGHGSTKY